MKGDFSKKQVDHLAKLAKLNLTDAEVEKYTNDLVDILSYVSQIQKLKLKRVEPLAHVTGSKNITRIDQKERKNIPTPKYFTTKKIL